MTVIPEPLSALILKSAIEIIELVSSISHSHIHFPEKLLNVVCQNSVCIREIYAVLGSNAA